ncbi:MAG TPA: hypothetical protein VFW47_11150 [Phenylobacterium sp.]|nr:hypothetical protein [Phenylobacterium sp.]
MRAPIAAAWLFCAPIASAAPPPVFASRLEGDRALVLAPNERVTLRLSPKGRLEIVSIDFATVDGVLPPTPGRKAPERPGGNPFIDAPEGTIAFQMAQVDTTVMLKVENGTSSAFDYEAWIAPGVPVGTLEPTSVCTALPLLAGFEQWPGRKATRLVLNRFQSKATNGVVCPQASGPPPQVVLPPA